MIRTVVVDDEPVARQGLLRLLREDEDLEIVGEAADGDEALELLRRERPDLVLLDIRMPGLDGIAVADALDDLDSPAAFVFVTAHDEHAVRAFELDAIDYVLKPFDRERLRDAMGRVKRRLRQETTADLHRNARELLRLFGDESSGTAARASVAPDRLVIRDGGTVVFLQPDEVAWIESAGNYVRIHAEGEEYLVRETLKRMEDRLDAARFLRVSRSAIVNLDRVREVRPQPNGTHEISLRDGTRFSASRRRGEELRAAIARLE